MSTRGLRVLVDAYWWVDGPPSNRHVLRETVLAWLRRFPEDRLALLVRQRDVEAVRTEMGRSVGVLGSRVWPHGLSNATALAAATLRWRPDVVHSQNYAMPVPGSFRTVFVHDVLWATNPEWFTAAELAYFAPMSPLARHADLVLTSSAAEAARIGRVTGARDIVPVGIGMSEELVSTSPEPPSDAPERFLLTVGRLNVRKNLAGVIDAALASGVLTPELPLLIVGAADGKSEALSDRARAAVKAGLVRFTGHVTDAELVWLYRNTTLFVFLSRGEGYGMPPVEALHFGAPVLVSTLEVFSETLPSAVPRVSPDDTEEAGRLIARIVSRQERVTLEQVPTWVETVERTRAAIIARR